MRLAPLVIGFAIASCTCKSGPNMFTLHLFSSVLAPTDLSTSLKDIKFHVCI